MLTCGGTYLLVMSSAIAWISRRSSVGLAGMISQTNSPSERNVIVSHHSAPDK